MRLAGCDTQSKQAPASAGDTPCEFYVCASCGIVGDYDESRGNDMNDERLCEACAYEIAKDAPEMFAGHGDYE